MRKCNVKTSKNILYSLKSGKRIYLNYGKILKVLKNKTNDNKIAFIIIMIRNKKKVMY